MQRLLGLYILLLVHVNGKKDLNLPVEAVKPNCVQKSLDLEEESLCGNVQCETTTLLKDYVDRLDSLSVMVPTGSGVQLVFIPPGDRNCGCSIGTLTNAAGDLQNSLSVDAAARLIHQSVTFAGSRFCLDPTGESTDGDIWLHDSGQGFPESLEMSRTVRNRYSLLATELGKFIQPTSTVMIADTVKMKELLVKMMDLLRDRKKTMTKAIAPFVTISTRKESAKSVKDILPTLNLKDRLVLILDVTRKFLDALFVLGRPWGFAESYDKDVSQRTTGAYRREEEESDSTSQISAEVDYEHSDDEVPKELFMEYFDDSSDDSSDDSVFEEPVQKTSFPSGVAETIQIAGKQVVFPQPLSVPRHTFLDDLNVFTALISAEFYSTSPNNCGGSRKGSFLRSMLPESMCKISESRRDEFTIHFVTFVVKLRQMDRNTFDQDTHKYLSALIANMKAAIVNKIFYKKNYENPSFFKSEKRKKADAVVKSYRKEYPKTGLGKLWKKVKDSGSRTLDIIKTAFIPDD